jgi:uncharacterized coiled-coil protein SlyX
VTDQQTKGTMEKRITTLEVRMDQTAKSIDHLDRSIKDLRLDMDKKFIHIEEKMDKKFIHIEEKMDKKFIHFEEKIDKRFVRIEEIIDRKFCWAISIQLTSMLAMMAMMGKIAQIY